MSLLTQILQDMYVDPDVLNELSEDQKQVLFVKMREEQVRRWNAFEDKMAEEDKKTPKKPSRLGKKKKVDFLLDRNGEPWTWIMGEHKNDRTVEQILEEEAQAKAFQQAEEEAKVLVAQEEQELKKIEEERLRLIKEAEEKEAEIKRKQEEAALYQSIKEARLAVERMELEKKRMEEEERKRLAELQAEEMRAKRRSMEVMDTVTKRRSCEIYNTWQKQRQTLEKMAEEGEKEVVKSWREQEKKAKEADKEKREMARQARIEYRESLKRSFSVLQAARAMQSTPGSKPPLPPKRHNKPRAPLPPVDERKHLMVTSAPGIGKKPRPLRPKGKDMIISWFQREEQIREAGTDPTTGKVAKWFHGIINREETEAMLGGLQDGAFLVRVSERVWGYTLSLKQGSRCKHFLIDASDLGYQFFGADQTIHDRLCDLVNFHKETPITISGREILREPCGQRVDPPDYWELYHGRKTESTAL